MYVEYIHTSGQGDDGLGSTIAGARRADGGGEGLGDVPVQLGADDVSGQAQCETQLRGLYHHRPASRRHGPIQIHARRRGEKRRVSRIVGTLVGNAESVWVHRLLPSGGPVVEFTIKGYLIKY